MAGLFVCFHADRILDSVSQYYYSGMRDVFVGALCSVALFLFFYRGYDNWGKINWDKLITTTCGFLAIGIAFFPGSKTESIKWVVTVHRICATLFFSLLACYSIFVFTRKAPDPTKQKLVRNKIFIVCGVVMIVSLIAIIIYYKFIQTEDSESSFVFWAEAVALVSFGISWLTKGGCISPDKVISKINDKGIPPETKQ
jgi:uncharacterized membrane protein